MLQACIELKSAPKKTFVLLCAKLSVYLGGLWGRVVRGRLTRGVGGSLRKVGAHYQPCADCTHTTSDRTVPCTAIRGYLYSQHLPEKA